MSAKRQRERDVDHNVTAWSAYTDGGCKPNPGRGGYGVVLLENGVVVRELMGGERHTSNNRMELTAALEALRAVPESTAITVHTDSSYVKNGITSWLPGWRRRGWKTADGEDVKNRDLWEALAEVNGRRAVKWVWVRAHTGIRFNERADFLATRARDGQSRPPTEPTTADPVDGVELFCAASFSGPSARGGYAATLTSGAATQLCSGFAVDTTANRMHLQAAIEGLSTLVRLVGDAASATESFPAAMGDAHPHASTDTREASVGSELWPQRGQLRVHSASDYVIDGASRWLPGWKSRNWRTVEGSDVKNRDQWEPLEALLHRLCEFGFAIEWHSVKRGDEAKEQQAAKARASAEANDAK